MFYREYRPTCIETLFGGKTPKKFKARAIVPQDKDLTLDFRQCLCNLCKKAESPTMNRTCDCEYSHNGNNSLSRGQTPDMYGGGGMRSSNTGYKRRGSDNERRQMNNRTTRETDHFVRRCHCLSCEAERRNDAQENTVNDRVTRQDNIQQDNKRQDNRRQDYCELCASERRDKENRDRRFCDVCQQWVSSTQNTPNNEYSSRAYESYEEQDDCDGCQPTSRNREGNNKQKNRLILESCKICEVGHENNETTNNDLEEDGSDMNQYVEIENSMKENRNGCFTIGCSSPQRKYGEEENGGKYNEDSNNFQNVEESLREGNKMEQGVFSSDNTCDDQACSIGHNNKIPPQGHLMETSFIPERENLAQNPKEDEKLEQYKKDLYTELRKIVDGSRTTEFRCCGCKHSNKQHCKGRDRDLGVDELKAIKDKCEEALAQVNFCKREIANSKKAPCSCDHESTRAILEDCKIRCAQLEKQVGVLQNALQRFVTEEGGKGGSPGRAKWDKNCTQAKPTSEQRDPIIRVTMGTHKKKATTRYDVRRPGPQEYPGTDRKIPCHHMRCFPPEQIPEISSFKDCPGKPKINIHYPRVRKRDL